MKKRMTLKDHSNTGREKSPPTLDTGIKCWGACITSALLLLINIGTINGFGVIMQEFGVGGTIHMIINNQANRLRNETCAISIARGFRIQS